MVMTTNSPLQETLPQTYENWKRTHKMSRVHLAQRTRTWNAPVMTWPRLHKSTKLSQNKRTPLNPKNTSQNQ